MFTEQDINVLKMALDTLLATHQNRIQLAAPVAIVAAKLDQIAQGQIPAPPPLDQVAPGCEPNT